MYVEYNALMHKKVSRLYTFLVHIEVRTKLIIATLLMCMLFFLGLDISFSVGLFTILPALIILSAISSYIVILVGIKRVEWFTLFIMPILYTMFLYLLHFLLPGRLLTKIPLTIIFGIGFYAIVLASNIFNVAKIKNLQLQRAAFSVNLLAQVLICYLGISVFFTVFNHPLNVLLFSWSLIFVLSVQLFWSIKPSPFITKQIIKHAIFSAFMMLQFVFTAMLLPIANTVSILLVAGSYYSFAGIMVLFFEERLYGHTIKEYVYSWIFIVILITLSVLLPQ